MQQFPADIQDFANSFVMMQLKRHDADYVPTSQFSKSEAQQDILDAETVIRKFRDAPTSDRRAFAAYVLLKKRVS